VHIYHTLDYFQSYIMFEHIIEPQGVNVPKTIMAPKNMNLNIYPSPTNTAFNISYELNAMLNVKLMIYDILGRQVWRNNIGIQSPGIHLLSFANDQLPSGRYFLLLQSQQGQIAKAITIIK